eukprot:CAMPEP_0176393106 /NCGR_PEP_ID=MMETSP0126-20121128/41429_1 /TAXON_ID=141414 ORGANISM="Strombidinopsis acuminatum, Strain SPMC142" /NCGR_SAMPLE_ID=MMETSP0126 /ASSEMBLY_ACC=CAM_ASM_000229 /LENGTH=58 /DNA_ID=CAMNT_0017764357 /DNA_START=194 /DNA_END=370 /DNA_ORIENTATION=+
MQMNMLTIDMQQAFLSIYEDEESALKDAEEAGVDEDDVGSRPGYKPTPACVEENHELT